MTLSIDKFILSVLVFSVIVVSGTLMISDLNSSYSDVNISDDDFDDSLNQVDDIYTLSGGAKDDVSGGEVDDETTENSLFKGGFKSARRFFTGMFSIPGQIIKSIADVIGIPRVFVDAAIAALLVILTFALIYLVFRFRDR